MECTIRCVVIVASCLVLLSIIQGTSQDMKVSVTYLLGRPAENCNSACASRGMSCVEVGAFPSNALSIFHSINVTCATTEETNNYLYKDHPNYCISGEWNGRCMGFKIPNAASHATLCHRGQNPTVRRLCPCRENISTTAAPSTITLTITPSTASPSTTTASPSTSTTAILVGTPTNSQNTSNKTELSTWLIIVMAVAIVLVISGLIFVIVFVLKKRKSENNSSPKIRSAPEQTSKTSNIMDGSDNIIYMESVVDMNSPTKSSTTDNILYESSGSPHDPGYELNELYVLSCEDEKNSILTTVNPIYGDEDSGVDNTGITDGEYASIDEV